MNSDYPLISVFCSVKNRSICIRRCIESILSQDYPNVDIIIQDGMSTDGTLEILKEYGEKIALVSEPDNGAEDGFFKALSRVNGDIFCACLSDEELMPGALSWAADRFREHPKVDVIYTDYYSTDIKGNIINKGFAKQWDYEKYLCHEFAPPFCSTFFRKNCLDNIKSCQRRNCGEFEIWVKLGKTKNIKCIPGFFASKYAVHDDSNVRKASTFNREYEGRMNVINDYLSKKKNKAESSVLRKKILGGLHTWMAIGLLRIENIKEAFEQVNIALKYLPNEQIINNLMSQIISRTCEDLLKIDASNLYDYISSSRYLEGEYPDMFYVKSVYFDKCGQENEMWANLNEAKSSIMGLLKKDPYSYDGLELLSDVLMMGCKNNIKKLKDKGGRISIADNQFVSKNLVGICKLLEERKIFDIALSIMNWICSQYSQNSEDGDYLDDIFYDTLDMLGIPVAKVYYHDNCREEVDLGGNVIFCDISKKELPVYFFSVKDNAYYIDAKTREILDYYVFIRRVRDHEFDRNLLYINDGEAKSRVSELKECWAKGFTDNVNFTSFSDEIVDVKFKARIKTILTNFQFVRRFEAGTLK